MERQLTNLNDRHFKVDLEDSQFTAKQVKAIKNQNEDLERKIMKLLIKYKTSEEGINASAKSRKIIEITSLLQQMNVVYQSIQGIQNRQSIKMQLILAKYKQIKVQNKEKDAEIKQLKAKIIQLSEKLQKQIQQSRVRQQSNISKIVEQYKQKQNLFLLQKKNEILILQEKNLQIKQQLKNYQSLVEQQKETIRQLEQQNKQKMDKIEQNSKKMNNLLKQHKVQIQLLKKQYKQQILISENLMIERYQELKELNGEIVMLKKNSQQFSLNKSLRNNIFNLQPIQISRVQNQNEDSTNNRIQEEKINDDSKQIKLQQDQINNAANSSEILQQKQDYVKMLANSQQRIIQIQKQYIELKNNFEMLQISQNTKIYKLEQQIIQYQTKLDTIIKNQQEETRISKALIQKLQKIIQEKNSQIIMINTTFKNKISQMSTENLILRKVESVPNDDLNNMPDQIQPFTFQTFQDSEPSSIQNGQLLLKNRIQQLENEIKTKDELLMNIQKWLNQEQPTNNSLRKQQNKFELKNKLRSYFNVSQQNVYLKKCMQKITQSQIFWENLSEQTREKIIIEEENHEPQVKEQVQTNSKNKNSQKQKCIIF